MNFFYFIGYALLTFISINIYAYDYLDPFYYDIKDTKYLSENNEFNTTLEELEYLEISPYWLQQTGLNTIPQPERALVKVCIIDSGIDYEHDDIPKHNLNGYKTKYGEDWSVDYVSHGTHIAGIISALNNDEGIRGAIDNGNIELHIQKVINVKNNNSFEITEDNLISSIEVCANEGSNIINLSLSSPNYSGELQDLINRLTNQNDIIFVASAGNHGVTNSYVSKVYPAAYNNVVSVGAININNELIGFSPAYDGIDIVAPGIDILSLISKKKNSVESVYYENGDIYTEFNFYQLDEGAPYPSHFPTNELCYYSLEDEALESQILNSSLSNSHKNTIQEASNACKASGQEMLIITYDAFKALDNEDYQNYNIWLESLDFETSFPTLLMPGLSIDEINFFKEGDINVYSIDKKYAALTGTSQAAAIVTAGLAKLWSNFPELNAMTIIEATKLTGKPVNGSFLSEAVGYGAVNFADAYNYLENEEYLVTPSCPALWDEHKSYEQGDTTTFAGIIYKARYQNKNDSPAKYHLNQGTWQQSSVCSTFDNELNETSNENDKSSDTTYELNIERVETTFYCNSYSLDCGGGNFGGWGGVNFGAGSGSRGSSGAGSGEGGGGNSKSSSDKEKTEEEKKKYEEQKQKEYEDIKKRADAPPPKQKSGESKEAYNKRLWKYYDKLAEDIKKWDDKYKPGDHAKKIPQIKNRAKKYRIAYERAAKHKEVKERYQNQREKEKSQCKGSGRGVVKIITGIACRIK